jgi:predicted NBD/HSP70 family sugar kinase
MHPTFEDLLVKITGKLSIRPEVVGDVFSRIMIAAPGSVPRVDIADGIMLAHWSPPLSQATVSKITKELLRVRLIAEEPARADRPGRPVVPLGLDRDHWGVLGIHVLHRQHRPIGLTGVLVNLRGDVLEAESVPLEVNEDPGSVAGMLGEAESLAERLIDKSGGRQILGLGIEIGGHVYQGKVIESTNAGWTQVDFCTPLSEQLKLPVVLENDASALAVWETYRHRYPERDMALVAVFDEGVGCGLIVDGRVYRGGHGMAAEIGHLTVDYTLTPQRHRPPPRAGQRPRFKDACPCGQYGHVDALAPPTRILGELGRSDLQSAASLPSRSREEKKTAAAQVFETAGTALGRGLAALINVINPARIVLLLPASLAEAAPGTAGNEYLQAIESAVDQAFSTGPLDARAHESRLTIHRLDQLDDHAPDQSIEVSGARGAAITVLDAFVDYARGTWTRSPLHANDQAGTLQTAEAV